MNEGFVIQVRHLDTRLHTFHVGKLEPVMVFSHEGRVYHIICFVRAEKCCDQDWSLLP